MLHYITYQPHPRLADDTSLYTFIYKCIHSGIIHRTRIKSKYNVAQQSHYQIEYNIRLPTYDSLNIQEGSPRDIFQRLKLNCQLITQPPTSIN